MLELGQSRDHLQIFGHSPSQILLQQLIKKKEEIPIPQWSITCNKANKNEFIRRKLNKVNTFCFFLVFPS